MTGPMDSNSDDVLETKDVAEEILKDHFDEYDYRIFEALNEDGRMSDTELAERVGLSRTAVRRRRENLTESGIFQVLAVLVLQEANLAYADIRISVDRNVDSEARDQLIKQLVDADLAYSVDTCMGEYDLFVRTWHESLNALKSYIWDLLDEQPAIDDYDLTPVVKTWKAWDRKLEDPLDN